MYEIKCERYPSLKVFMPDQSFIQFTDGVYRTSDKAAAEYVQAVVEQTIPHKPGVFKGRTKEMEEIFPTQPPKEDEAPAEAPQIDPEDVLMLSVRAAREKLDEVTDPDFFRQAVAIEENAEQPRSSMITYLHERLALLS